MACHLIAPYYYLNQLWLIVDEVLWMLQEMVKISTIKMHEEITALYCRDQKSNHYIDVLLQDRDTGFTGFLH